MTEKEKIGTEKETYMINPEPQNTSGLLFKGSRGTLPFGRATDGHIECMVKRYHWLVGSPDGLRYDIKLMGGDGLNELDQLQTSFSAYPYECSFRYEAEIKSLRRRAEYRTVGGMPSAGDIETAFEGDPRSGVVLLGRAFRNSLTAIACKGPVCQLNGSILRALTESGCINAEEAEAIATVLDYADIAMHMIRFELPGDDMMAWWLSIYGKVAAMAVKDRYPT